MPTPALYADGNPAHFADVPAAFRSNTIDVLYVTDRAREDLDDGAFRYTNGRSASLAYGSAMVQVGESQTTWDQLVLSSTSASGGRLRIGVTSITEAARLPETPLPPVRKGELIVDDPAGVAEQQVAALQFCEDIGRRLTLTPRKEAFVFVHGVNNTFDSAVCRIAALWHFLGREGVPIAYTWPAGAPGIFGYFRDRESGEFTIFHLKQFLRVLSKCPELKHIHVIAHSRGTDVALSALRELFIEARAAGDNPRQRFKIRTIVLAAADLDLEVAQQRIVAERMSNGAEQSVVYVSPNDRAIGLSQWLFNSIDRIGNLRVGEFQALRQSLPPGNQLQFINVEQRTGFLSHSYFLDDPAVSSDLGWFCASTVRPGLSTAGRSFPSTKASGSSSPIIRGRSFRSLRTKPPAMKRLRRHSPGLLATRSIDYCNTLAIIRHGLRSPQSVGNSSIGMKPIAS